MFNKILKKIGAIATALTLVVGSFTGLGIDAQAQTKSGDVISVTSLDELTEGRYELDASLSCYLSAMSGIEFGESLLTKVILDIDSNKSATMTLGFTTGSVLIYSATANTFVSDTYYYSSDKVGYLGIEDNGSWRDASYNLSGEASVIGNSSNGPVASKYVTSMSVPLARVAGTYKLALAINSDVMGMQFGGAGASYDANLTVDWSNTKVIDVVTNYDVTVAASPVEGGNVAGGKNVAEGESVTVNATANAGYTFVKWTVNGAEVSKEASYTFTPSENTDLVAVFEKEEEKEEGSKDEDNENQDVAGTVISVSDLSELKEGTYQLDSTLSCYVAAMGGVEFGNGLMKKSVLQIDEKGDAKVTLHLGTSSLNIYGVNTNTFVSATKGKTQYWNGTSWVDAAFTTHNDGYVNTMTFPITKVEDTYAIALYVDSDTKGQQFGGENATYDGTFASNWSKVTVIDSVDDSDEDDSNNEDTDANTNGNTNGNTSGNTNGSTSGNTSGSTNGSSSGTIVEVTSLADLDPGQYGLKAALSCYVNAMGGVEFGAPLLKGAVLDVAEDGSGAITLSFQTSSVNIYGVTANTYIATTEGKTQYYNGSSWVDASYTADSNGYMRTMTFPIDEVEDAYKLALYVGSDVMGTQFGGADSNYDATLTIGWDQVSVGGDGSIPKTGDTLPVATYLMLLMASLTCGAFAFRKKVLCK